VCGKFKGSEQSRGKSFNQKTGWRLVGWLAGWLEKRGHIFHWELLSGFRTTDEEFNAPLAVATSLHSTPFLTRNSPAT